ncbi:TIGR00645 family protein [Microbacterium sp. S308A+]|uniref:TIGR00645 family protein n=1 Tax=Microbacterium sp. S308A+ TaxID=3415135 RepID=UPI003C7C3A03
MAVVNQTTDVPTPLETPARNPWAKGISSLIFVSRWLQAPLYVGLIVAQLIYVWVFMVELWHLIEKVFSGHGLNESQVMLAVLGLIDVVMIANLLIMVIIGGYETFVSRINVDGHPDQPEWLSHVNANVLKVKLAMAIIGISSIHLLKTFIEVGAMSPVSGTSSGPEKYTSIGVFWQVTIHVVFIISALALAWIDKMSQGTRHVPAPQSGPNAH